METLPPRLLLGTADPAAPVLALRAGPLHVRLSGTRLLALHAGGHEVWHGAWFLYRDTGWGTPEPVVDRLEQLALGQGAVDAPGPLLVLVGVGGVEGRELDPEPPVVLVLLPPVLLAEVLGGHSRLGGVLLSE